ncbi:hypothetical protein [Psychrobacter sp. I-STPA10]|uniref:hypothetical protein n=1 Tax=Psychrobacter sp. I-STPA10 TaxID=2585769 RepID=UPI001E4176E2|nr:hypothetical protein [Psychrobacter sp. I-STPA10]
MISLNIKKVDDPFYQQVYPQYFVESIINNTTFPIFFDNFDNDALSTIYDPSFSTDDIAKHHPTLNSYHFTLNVLANISLDFTQTHQVLYRMDKLSLYQINALEKVFDDERKNFIELYNNNDHKNKLPHLSMLLAKSIVRNIIYGIYCGAVTRQQLGKLVYDILTLCKQHLTDFYRVGLMISSHDAHWYYLVQAYNNYKKEQNLEE